MAILSRAVDLDAVDPFDGVVLAYECSPDVVDSWSGSSRVVRLNDIVEDHGSLAREAFLLVSELVPGSPTWRGVSLLDLWRAPIADELYRLMVWQRILGFVDAEFPGGPLVVDDAGAAALTRSWLPGRSLAVLPGAKPSGTVRRRLRVVRTMLRDGWRQHGIPTLASLIASQLDPTHRWRRMLSVRRPKVAAGSTWLVSSYQNYGQVLAAYARSLGEPPQALVFGTSGRRPLAGVLPSSHLHTPAAFASRRPIAGAELRALSADVTDVVRSGLAQSHPGLEVLTAGPWWGEYTSRILPIATSLIDVFTELYERAEPARVVTANQYSLAEGAALAISADRQIPTVQLQHGILEARYLYDRLRSDEFVVSGSYWRDAFPASERCRVTVQGQPAPARPAVSRIRDAVVFFTASLQQTPFVEPRQDSLLLLDALREVLERRPSMSLIVRVHPAESVSSWEQLWDLSSERRRLRVRGRVSFDRTSKLSEVVGRTKVGLTYFSTVAFECIRQAVPLVAVGWYSRPIYRDDFAKLGVWSYARNRADVVRHLLAAIDGAAVPSPEAHGLIA